MLRFRSGARGISPIVTILTNEAGPTRQAARPMPAAGGKGLLREFQRQAYIAWFFAWSDTKARYRRTVLGPLWLVLGTALGVVGLGYVWSVLFNLDQGNFIPDLAMGLIIWQMLSGSIIEAVSVFYNNAAVIKNIRTPSYRISLQLLFTQLINFAHNVIVVVVVLIIYQKPVTAISLLALPGLLLVLVNLAWVIQLFGFLGARYRDLQYGVAAVMPLLFFMSPVMYRSQQLGVRAEFAAFNPLAHWIDLIREPMDGNVPYPLFYVLAVATAVAGWAVAIWITYTRGHRLAYWI